MAKKELKLRALVAPSDTVVVSAYDENGRADACTLAFYMVSSHVPPCVTIAINATQRRKTLQSILNSGAFAVGFPSVAQVKEADYLGVESGYNTDKLKKIGWDTEEGRQVHAPVIQAIPLSLECQVVHTVTVGSHTQITGEVKAILAEESIVNEKGRVQLEALQPLIYDEEAARYLRVGEPAAEAFKTGLQMKKELEGEKR